MFSTNLELIKDFIGIKILTRNYTYFDVLCYRCYKLPTYENVLHILVQNNTHQTNQQNAYQHTETIFLIIKSFIIMQVYKITARQLSKKTIRVTQFFRP